MKRETEASQPLRERRAEATRDAIREGVRALLAEEHPAALSIPAVAKRSGVSVRTIYRYFPSKQALLDDVAAIHMRRADAVLERRQALFDQPEEYIKVLWRDFADDLPAVQAQHQSPTGAELRRSRLDGSRTELLRRLEKGFPDLAAEERRDICDLILVMTSSAAFLDFHTRLDRSPEDAARLATWAVRAMQKQLKHDGGIIT